MTRRRTALVVALLGGCSHASLPVRNVTLYQNGLGYFERTGRVDDHRLRLRLRAGEVDDVLKTLTVLREGGGVAVGSMASVRAHGAEVDVELSVPGRGALRVAYAVPTPVWRAAYRLVLDESDAVVQTWAIVTNSSDEDWKDVHLTLATGAPMSYAVDLHTPRFVARPDASGHLVEPTTIGLVKSESAKPGDRDGDGIPDADDLCPEQPEDKDGFEDTDGCPDPDNDKDRILDAQDKCPNEPETYNGYDDEDGCPDKGRVIIKKGSLMVLDKIYFESNKADIKEMSEPIIEAIAATLKGNPQIVRVEVRGHAAMNEKEPLGLAAQRANAITAALVRLGVARERLQPRGHGATQAARAGATEDAYSMNRNVDFFIVRQKGDELPAPTAEAVEHSVAASAAVHSDVAGMMRHELTAPLSLQRGSASMLALTSVRVVGEEVYLYRPDPGAPTSTQYPFRAAHFTAPKDVTLDPGSVAIYARGTFVGDALLERLHAGDTTFLPFAIDSSAFVHLEQAESTRPLRIVSIDHGVAQVEDEELHHTTYTLRAGSTPPKRAFIRHPRHEGFALVDAIGVEESAGGYLLPMKVQANAETTLAVDETHPRGKQMALAESDDGAIGPYAAGTTLPEAMKTTLGAIVALQRDLARTSKEQDAVRTRLQEIGERQAQLRDDLASIGKSGTDKLRRELQTKLTASVREGEQGSQKNVQLESQIHDLEKKLDLASRDLTWNAK